MVERMVTYKHSTSHTDWPLTYIDNSGYNITVDCNGWSVLAPLDCILLHCGFHNICHIKLGDYVFISSKYTISRVQNNAGLVTGHLLTHFSILLNKVLG